VLMHEVPLESTGGGVLLRGTLRCLSGAYRLTAVFPSYPHQLREVGQLVEDLRSEGTGAVPIPVVSDWGRWSFTVRRFLSSAPGSVCAMRTRFGSDILASATGSVGAPRWLLMAPFGLPYLPEGASPRDVRLYFTNVDEEIVVPVDNVWWRRMEARVERWKVRRFVRQASGRAGKCAAITAADATALTTRTGRQVSFLPPLMAPRTGFSREPERGRVLLTTNFTYAHNRVSLEWFLREVWPRVGCAVHLDVTGLDTPDGSLARLCGRAPRVTYRGFLPKRDLDTYFSRCAVAVNPTVSGSGFQIKMLDALARGVPVVSTARANPLGDRIPASDDPHVLADLVTQSGTDLSRTFDYVSLHREARREWLRFLA
jgi:hypothetical protein